MVSENASIMNRPMRAADKEDLHMTMQKVNPMKENIIESSREKKNQVLPRTILGNSEETNESSSKKKLGIVNIDVIQAHQHLPPNPVTVTPKAVEAKMSNPGRTIEVQTDLSMVTMEQYSQGNSKAFNKTTDFQQQDQPNNGDAMSVGSPNILLKNELNQNNKEAFSNVLSKPQF